MAAKTAAPLGRLLTSEETAAHLGIEPETLRKWRRDGRGPVPVQDGPKYIRYAESDIDAWARAHRADPAA